MRVLALSAVLILTGASCGSDDTPASGSAVPTSVVSVPETTATTTPPPIAWTDVDAYPSGFEAGCCGANSAGPTSPALTEAPGPLADGTYSLEVVGWSPDDPTLLQISVRALMPCADGVKECSPSEDGTYGPRDIGFSETSRQIELVLDDSVLVYLAGDDASGSLEDGLSSILRSTNGNGLAALMTAIADAYDTAIAAPLSSGTPIDDIVADLQANPMHGFTSAAEQLTGQLYFTFDDAPPVLFQAVANQGAPLERSGTSALIPRTFTLEDGTISLEFYAGFRS